MNIELEKFSIYFLSVGNNLPKEIITDGEIEDNDINNYIKHIINETTTPPKNQKQIKGQYFNFKNMDELVARNLKEIILDLTNKKWKELTASNAKKLLDVEKVVKDEIAQLKHEVRSGCLLQIKCKLNNHPTLFLVKIDDNTFLDNDIMKLKTGLPFKTRMQKVAIITFNDKFAVESLLLSDTNSNISKYWKTDFLIAEPLRDEKTNTSNAFNAIYKLLKTSIKKKSSKDYYFIRNQVIIDFRKERFSLSELVDNLKKYEPIDDKLDSDTYEKFITKLEQLPTSDKSSFDTEFDIEPSVVKAKLNNKIMIDNNFELIVKGEVKDLMSKFGTGIDEETNQKYVKIYSDEGYDMFERSTPTK